MADLSSPVAEADYVAEAEALARSAAQLLSEATGKLLELAQDESRALDDNHVGTEHLVLGIFALGPNRASRAHERFGITRELFLDQLHYEEGPSPPGRIPMTARARMIVGLAGVEARRLRSPQVEPERILLGVVREGEKWRATRKAGPQHLRSAVTSAGATLEDIAQSVTDEA